MTDAISAAGLVKSFGSFRALDGLDLSVPTGEVHGFLGPNGAGKTTTIRVLLGLLRADAGAVSLLGGDPWRDAVDLHRRLAYVPGDVSLWPKLTGGETIDLFGRLRGDLDPARRDELVERFELDPTKRARTYSKGNRQKVALIAALASPAELLILDEPTSGLDPLMEEVFQHCIREVRERGPHGAAVEPHPRRGRGAVRSGEHHPQRTHGRGRHARLDAPAHPHLDPRRDRTGRRRRSTVCEGVHGLTIDRDQVRFDVDTVAPGRGGAAPQRRGAPDVGQHPADARGAVPPPLRRRAGAESRTSEHGPRAVNDLTGTLPLVRLIVRRDRRPAPALDRRHRRCSCS